jgi:hypothetical protein
MPVPLLIRCRSGPAEVMVARAPTGVVGVVAGVTLIPLGRSLFC